MKSKIEIELPGYIKKAIFKLENSGFETFVVGGAVRDSIIGREIYDYDLATNALPEQNKEIFKDYNIIDIGSKYGTVIVEIDGFNIEITTYREDEEYLDGRRPSDVKFTKSLKSDLSRRDFTINAMAYNPNTGLVDEFHGMKDIENKVIRTVGDANKRFTEDYLRIMRAIRFSSQLGFKLDKEVVGAIIFCKIGLKDISRERIRDEFDKILLSQNPGHGLRILSDTGVLKIISKDIDYMVDFNQHSSFHDYDLFEHSIRVIENAPAKLEIRLAALFHDIGKPATMIIDERGEGRFFGHQKKSRDIAEKFLKEYRYSGNTIQKVLNLVERHMDNTNRYTEKSVKKLISRLGEDVFDLFDLQEADILGTNRPDFIENINNGRRLARDIIENKIPVKKSQLAVNGYDLIEIGYTQGRKIGDILNILTDIVIDDPSKNTKETLVEIAKKYK